VSLKMIDERRSGERKIADQKYSAIVRISGVPIYQLKLKDISQRGTCLIAKEDSAILRHLKIGQELEMRYHYRNGPKSGVHYMSEIRHVTKAEQGRYKGHFFIGTRIVSKLAMM
jgi:hypothetical protein